MSRLPFYTRIILCIALGICVGLLLGKNAAPLGELGAVVIQLIKALAGPLLFFAVLDAFMRTSVNWSHARRMVGISALNGMIALTVGLCAANIFKPGLHMASVHPVPKPSTAEPINFVKAIAGFIPTSVVEPFVSNSIIPMIILAVLAGLSLRHVKNEQITQGETGYRGIEDAIGTIYKALTTTLGWIVALVPIAIFGVVAKVIGEFGFAPFKGLIVYFVVVLLALGFQVGVVYQSWLLIFKPITLRKFWSGARDPVIYAMGASSSLATLPLTLRSLDKMGVSPQSARMAACVGTNLNNDGILLYEALAMLCVAQYYGVHLTLGQQALAAVSCAIAGVGIAGVPESGLISLSLVLVTVGLPTELLPLLLSVDWVLSRARAVTNVISDMLVASLLDKFDTPSADSLSADQGQADPTCQ